MISQMDQIYANASVTIIAAADGDTELGLCGVSMPRQLKRRVNIQDVALLELPGKKRDLRYSKWATRGWTFQEGYLSSRRLIFTNTQVLFVCNRMNATESLQKLLGTTCACDDMSFDYLIPQHGSVETSTFSASGLLFHIQEYSKRELSRPSDSLNAILGVLNFYTKITANLTEPVLQLPWGLIAEKHEKKDSFDLRFFWHHGRQLPTRRADFPSWSWTGWGGPLKFSRSRILLQPKSTVEEDRFSYLEWQLSMRDTDGKSLEMYDIALQEFETRKSKVQLHQPGPKQLLVSCLVIRVSFPEFDLTKDSNKEETEVSIGDTGELISVLRSELPDASVTFQIWRGIYVAFYRDSVHWDQQIEKQDDVLGLLLPTTRSKYGWQALYCLLVRQVGEGVYERVGMLFMDEVLLLHEYSARRCYVDEVENALDKFTISDTQRWSPFANTAERRTICLV